MNRFLEGHCAQVQQIQQIALDYQAIILYNKDGKIHKQIRIFFRNEVTTMLAAFSRFGSFGRYFAVLFSSMLPVLENKGSIVLGAALHVRWYLAYLCSTFGSFFPASLLIGGGRRLREALRRIPFCKHILEKIDGFIDRHQAFFSRHAYVALALVISIPFTGVGIWAGCVLSNLLGLDKERSALAVAVGILLSGLFTTLAVYGVAKSVAFLLNFTIRS